jgi:hypothetical protein
VALRIDLKLSTFTVSDEDMIVVLTTGLPTSYTRAPIIISFDALESSKLTIDFIITRLLNEEGRQATPLFSPNNVKTEDPDNIWHFTLRNSTQMFSVSIAY